MNTDVTLLGEGQAQDVEEGFFRARQFIEESERRFTRFSDKSELCGLNRAAGRWTTVSDEMYSVLSEALACHLKTNGLFDPAILPQLRAAGYTKSMDEIRADGSVPSWQPVPKKPDGSFSLIEFDDDRRYVRLPEGMQIDLGGIAKGWIAERTTEILYRYSSACAVDAGGDICLKGHPDGQEFWEVEVEDPLDNKLDALVLRAQEGAVATSSVVKRAWKQDGKARHHLINPRTGEPAETRWLSVTVLAPHATLAETFAKAFLIADPDEARELSIRNPELTVLGIDKKGSLADPGTLKEQRNVNQ
jgi:thiamine biosynthesis lipoprotein